MGLPIVAVRWRKAGVIRPFDVFNGQMPVLQAHSVSWNRNEAPWRCSCCLVADAGDGVARRWYQQQRAANASSTATQQPQRRCCSSICFNVQLDCYGCDAAGSAATAGSAVYADNQLTTLVWNHMSIMNLFGIDGQSSVFFSWSHFIDWLFVFYLSFFFLCI